MWVRVQFHLLPYTAPPPVFITPRSCVPSPPRPTSRYRHRHHHRRLYARRKRTRRRTRQNRKRSGGTDSVCHPEKRPQRRTATPGAVSPTLLQGARSAVARLPCLSLSLFRQTMGLVVHMVMLMVPDLCRHRWSIKNPTSDEPSFYCWESVPPGRQHRRHQHCHLLRHTRHQRQRQRWKYQEEMSLMER